MIVNVVDRRSREYRWKTVDAIAEATWHDNTVDDSDQALPDEMTLDYASLPRTSLSDAIAWASKMDGQITLFLYDAGGSA